ncbi:PhzF family phenazine biosynthesis protein [Simplicispira hankyongi]|uniref:PhzF family phenazine biosynthesis protein n=1 Tax=Simplicispira hankyongi TaxID=2315688 RepID=A0A398CEK0_9BURK|nr:PhzF family phenazine biosynthesis protein [Simplicispira hankyongi]RID97283.1 PhzF family phenazine biosynthesis protein [Simplicispira hankyongi]
MTYLPFLQVDVFSEHHGDGNPLAVVLDAEHLPERTLRRFAAWTNLSETTFLLPPTESARAAGADYRVRIFTPRGELPFAGHPTLGSCYAWLHAGGQPRSPGTIVQECTVGLVPIRQQQGRLAFAAPPMQQSAPNPAMTALVVGALGLRPQQVRAARLLNNGPRWLALLVDSKEAVLGLTPDHARLKDLGQDVGIVYMAGEAHANGEPDAFVRGFSPSLGTSEDPVTGSLNASLAQWLIGQGLAPHAYLVAQGECRGRAGRVYIEQDGEGQVWVGGNCLTAIEGRAHFP